MDVRAGHQILRLRFRGYGPIPGQPHRHLSIVEEAIQATKRTMDWLVAEYPEMSTEEVLSKGNCGG